jgi:hypothetical protein
MRLHGPLQVDSLTWSVQEIIRRHEVLRTTFIERQGQPLQVIGPALPCPLAILDLQALPEPEQEAQVRALAREAVRQPFDLVHGPLLRATLLRLAAEDHVLLLTMHHLVSDGWSRGVFWHELALFYAASATGTPAPLPALAIQYADFAHWQRQWLQGEVLETQLAYWRRQLAGMARLQMPTDGARPAVQTFRGARQPWGISPALTQALKTLSQRHGVTLFMTLLAALQTLLQRYSGQDDIVVGSLIAHRNRVETEGVIGFFVNTLVLRTDLSGDPPFDALLARVRDVAVGAYVHQDVPFEKLLEEVRAPRDLSRNPLFQVMFVLHNTPWSAPALPGLTLCPLDVDPGTTRFDLTLDLWETPAGLQGWFEYSTDLFQAATVARLGGHLHTLLEALVTHPERRLSQFSLVTPDEHQELLAAWPAPGADEAPEQCLHEMFEAQAARTPDAVALISDEACLSYHELNRRANQVAHYLRALGVGPEVLVALCMPRSL